MLKKNKASDTVFKSLLTVTFVICLAAAGETAPAGTPPFSRESIEWCDIWISHADETNLPRVLLIGDSISRDYYPGVEKVWLAKPMSPGFSPRRLFLIPFYSRK